MVPDASATLTLTIDHLAPAIDGPHATFPVGGTLLSVSGPLRLTWDATDDLSGVDHYALRQRVDGGSFLTVSLPGPLTETMTRSVQFGREYEFRLRAVDGAGNEDEAATASARPEPHRIG